MAYRRPRRRFTREYKVQAVQRLIESGRPLADIAAELDVSPGQLSQWRNEHLAAGSAEALAVRKAEQAETQRLKREVKRLEEEVEILRKAAAFSPGGSRDEVRLRIGRAGESRRSHAVPSHRCERQRLLRLAPRDPHRPQPCRGGSRAARADRPRLHRPPAGLRLATRPRRAAPGRAAAFAPTRRAADARDGALGPPGPPPYTPNHGQPPSSPGRPEPAGAELHRGQAGPEP